MCVYIYITCCLYTIRIHINILKLYQIKLHCTIYTSCHCHSPMKSHIEIFNHFLGRLHQLALTLRQVSRIGRSSSATRPIGVSQGFFPIFPVRSDNVTKTCMLRVCGPVPTKLSVPLVKLSAFCPRFSSSWMVGDHFSFNSLLSPESTFEKSQYDWPIDQLQHIEVKEGNESLRNARFPSDWFRVQTTVLLCN